MFFDFKQFKKRRLTPNFFIVGAQKCGTTSMHHYLDEHPEIFMSKPLKEPGYHVPWKVIQSYYERRNLKFRDRFSLLKKGILRGYEGEKIIGESSTFYSNGDYNLTKEVLQNNGVNPSEIQVLYLIRHPIERIISHFLHACRYNGLVGDINRFIETNDEAIGISCFGKHLEGYFSFLSEEQICILEFEDLVSSPAVVLKKVHKFLKVPHYELSEYPVKNAAPDEQQNLRDAAVLTSASLQKITMAMEEDLDRLAKFYPVEVLNWDLSPASWLRFNEHHEND